LINVLAMLALNVAAAAVTLVLVLQQAQLESGDIIIFQKAVPDLPPGHPAAAAAADGSSSLIKAEPQSMDLDDGAAEQQQQQVAQLTAQQQQDLQAQVQQQLAAVQQHPHAELLKCRYPRVPEFLSYIRNRRLVSKHFSAMVAMLACLQLHALVTGMHVCYRVALGKLSPPQMHFSAAALLNTTSCVAEQAVRTGDVIHLVNQV
jgi:hypothetical protein